MRKSRWKIKYKRKSINPVTTYILLSFGIIILSGILTLMNVQVTYNAVDLSKGEVAQVTTTVNNLFSYTGLKYIVGNATKNFIAFAPLSMFLVASLGLAICEGSGFFDVLFKRIFEKINNKILTFFVIMLATISSLINEVGFVVLIPVAAFIYKAKKRNPMIGVSAAFAGCAFGYGTSIFVGSLETQLIPYTTVASHLVDTEYHISLLSNLFIMIVTTIILSIVGSIIIEKIVAPRLGKYRIKKEFINPDEFEIIDDESTSQLALSSDYNEKKGYKIASIVALLFVIFFIYSVIPGLPGSGLLLDNTENTYLKQIFGNNSYFQDGFTFMISLLFVISGLVYGFASKKFKNDTDIINYCKEPLSRTGSLLLLFFVASQFISLFRRSNIGIIFSGFLANILSSFSFGGLIYVIIAMLIMLLSDFFLTGIEAKWGIFAPVVVPALMRSNIAPQFSQFIIRAVDSMSNGITPLYAYFVIFIGYMNIYNTDEKPITISSAMKIMLPYFIIISITWLLIIIGWYIIGIPIGPSVYPTI